MSLAPGAEAGSAALDHLTQPNEVWTAGAVLKTAVTLDPDDDQPSVPTLTTAYLAKRRRRVLSLAESAPMPTHQQNQLAFIAMLAVSACAPRQPLTPAPESQPHHELHLPPVGESVRVTVDGKSVNVTMSAIPHDKGTSASLLELWKVAFPTEDAALLHFDMVGSDGFRPSSRPRCTRLLTGAEIGAAHIDLITHHVSFDNGVNLPGCYRVKAVVSLDATR